MAETCRLVGDRAEEEGYVRPGLAHLRTVVRQERQRRMVEALQRQILGQIREHVVRQTFAGQAPDGRWIVTQLEAIGELDALVRELP